MKVEIRKKKGRAPNEPNYSLTPGNDRELTNPELTKIKKTAPKTAPKNVPKNVPKTAPKKVPNYPALSGQKRKPGVKSGDRTEGTRRQRKNAEGDSDSGSDSGSDSDMVLSGSEFDDFENVDGWDDDMSASDTEPIELKNIQNTGFVASEVRRLSNHSDELAQQYSLERDSPMPEQELDGLSQLLRQRNDKRGSFENMSDQGQSKFKTLAEDSEDEMPASANAPKKNGQTASSSQSAPKYGHVPYANIINGVGAELAGYSVNQLHA